MKWKRLWILWQISRILGEEGVITIGNRPLTISNLNLLFMETQVVYYDVSMRTMDWGELIIVSHNWLPWEKKNWVDCQFRIRPKNDYGSLYLVLNNGVVIKENEDEVEE